MTWLVTGGAGYIGAHVVRAMTTSGSEVVVIDDLSTGIADKVPAGVPLVVASLLDESALRGVLREHQIRGVIHLAAKKAVEESMRDPLRYYHENVEGFRCLLSAMEDTGVDRLVLSSSAAVYGMPDVDRVDENHPPRPINPYGQTKLACEWMTSAVAAASRLQAVSLRYFNVAGAGHPDLGDPSVTNLIPLVLRALHTDTPPVIFGDDYDTPDGTCIRDYIHVQDLAEAHVAATEVLEPGVNTVYNVSRGRGFSVREVVEVAQQVTGRDFPAKVTDRRPGDPARLVGTVDAIASDLGWQPRHDLRDMVHSAWEAFLAGAGDSDVEGSA